MINVLMAHEKSRLNTGVAIFHIQMKMLHILNQVSVMKKRKFKIQILNMSHVSVQVKLLMRMIENQQQRELKRSQR